MRYAILAAAALHTYYGQSHVVKGVDFAVNAGEAVSLMGRNGMGKTTLLRSLVGLTHARKGEVLVHGHPAKGMAPWRIAREGIAFVPEGRGVFPNLTVEENLVMAAGPGRDGRREWTRARVLELFPRLAERLSNLGNQLSGGEQQMLTIGRALMTNPSLLILDEATEGLSPLIRQEIWTALATVRAEGMAILVIDKNLRPLLELCDRHLILEKGRVVWSGSSSDLRADHGAQQKYLSA